jgi:hypothetical protein
VKPILAIALHRIGQSKPERRARRQRLPPYKLEQETAVRIIQENHEQGRQAIDPSVTTLDDVKLDLVTGSSTRWTLASDAIHTQDYGDDLSGVWRGHHPRNEQFSALLKTMAPDVKRSRSEYNAGIDRR